MNTVVIAWFKLLFLVTMTCIYLADVSTPRDVTIFLLSLICIVLF